jgi:hypothetical protein
VVLGIGVDSAENVMRRRAGDAVREILPRSEKFLWQILPIDAIAGSLRGVRIGYREVLSMKALAP